MNTAMKSTGNWRTSASAPERLSKFVVAAAIAALALATSHAGAATVVASYNFDLYANNASLTTPSGGSWSKAGTGAAVATTTAGLPQTGTGAALLTPGASTDSTWLYRSNTVIANPATSAEPIVTSSAGLRIVSPASGTANRSVVLGLQTYDSSVNNIGSALLVWDGANTYGFGANHLVLQFGWGDGSSDFGYDFGAVTSAQLSSIGYFDVSVSLDYSTGDIAFGWGNATLGHAFAIEAPTAVSIPPPSLISAMPTFTTPAAVPAAHFLA